MAHEALVSLNLLIESLLNTPDYIMYSILIREKLKLVHQEVWSLKSILELDHFEETEKLIALKGGIEEAIPKFRDLLQDVINKAQLLFSYPKGDGRIDKLLANREGYFWKIKREMISFLETMENIKEEYIAKLDMETSNKVSPLADEDFDGNTKDMVGVYDEDLHQLIHILTHKYLSREIILVAGMAGVGKTTIVKAVYNDLVISYCFDCHAFRRVGLDYNVKDILLDLLVCLFPDYNKILGMKKNEDELIKQIDEFMSGRRYLIVLDDVWDTGFLNDILRFLPDDNNGSRIIVTTRLSSLAFYFSSYKFENVHNIRFRNEKESWNLFCRKVFVEDSCPPGLEEVGKKIVKRCGGLPLGIISIANILSKAEKSLDYWEKVAGNKNFLALVTEEGSHMSESLYLSYKHLPPHLKECCLYFGVFPLNHVISVSKLFKLWDGEGLIQPVSFKTYEFLARKYLMDLVSHNIVLVHQKNSSNENKTCSTHYFFWHLLVREAANKKIFHLINNYDSAFSKGMQCQRRLCIHMNALLGFKCVSKSIESVSNVYSFLCTGPEHQYPVSICLGLTSIKVLDALTIRLYEFPVGILEQVELKYLAFTYDGKLPSSISRLENLVYLIVHRYHLTIINSSPSYIPIEIWNMQELRHLQVMGSDLPRPTDGAQLPNLLTLLGVSDRSCTKEILQSIPNLKKLGVQIVLPQGISKILHIFDHLVLLSKLTSFKCVMSNPNPRFQQILLLPESFFLSRLTKLTLSGCGFAWKHMSIIGKLKNLEVLKLRCYAFQGPEWVVDEKEFPKLEHLLLENTDLVHWRVGDRCFQLLKRLIIRHCYKLEEIPRKLGELVRIKMIELVDCSLSATASVKHILEEQRKRSNYELRLEVYSSLDEH